MVSVGDRYYWLGDMANKPAYVRVVSVPDHGWLTIEWEEDKKVSSIPAGLLDTARWKRVAGA